MFSSFSGQLLVSCDHPSAERDSFTDAVVYVHQHNAESASGFIVNKHEDTASLLTQALRTDDLMPAMDRCDLNFGGPVSLNRLSVLYSVGEQVQILQSHAAIERFAEGAIPFPTFFACWGTVLGRLGSLNLRFWRIVGSLCAFRGVSVASQPIITQPVG